MTRTTVPIPRAEALSALESAELELAAAERWEALLLDAGDYEITRQVVRASERRARAQLQHARAKQAVEVLP